MTVELWVEIMIIAFGTFALLCLVAGVILMGLVQLLTLIIK